MAFTIAFIVAFLMTFWLASPKCPLNILDKPNERSLHVSSTPKTGGLGLLAGVIVGWAYEGVFIEWPEELVLVSVAALLVAGISFLDDIKELPPLLRLIVHGVAASMLLFVGFGLDVAYLGAIITVFLSVWLLNLYNFMDGMDGFAGGMTVIGFGFLGVAGWMNGYDSYAAYVWCIAMAAAGFLVLNFPPARIFMGDAGSATLGFLVAAFSLWGIDLGLFPTWFPLLVFSPFIVDATVTLISRILRFEKFWRAHKTHYYQRLAQAGWGHRKTVLLE